MVCDVRTSFDDQFRAFVAICESEGNYVLARQHIFIQVWMVYLRHLGVLYRAAGFFLFYVIKWIRVRQTSKGRSVYMRKTVCVCEIYITHADSAEFESLL